MGWGIAEKSWIDKTVMPFSILQVVAGSTGDGVSMTITRDIMNVKIAAIFILRILADIKKKPLYLTAAAQHLIKDCQRLVDIVFAYDKRRHKAQRIVFQFIDQQAVFKAGHGK